MAIFQWMLWQCRADDASGCCASKENEEKLTAAVVHRLENGDSPAGLITPPTGFGESDGNDDSPGAHAVPRGSPFARRSSTGWKEPLATRADTPNDSRVIKSTLQVPPEFDEVQATARDGQELHDGLQALIRGFTRSLLRGVCLNVLLDDGRTLPTGAALDSDLTHLVLHVPNMQHPVALSSIEDLCSPSVVYEARGAKLVLPVPQEWCITLVLRGGNFLTLLFEDARLREYFEFCFKVVILAGNRPSGVNRPFTVPSDPLAVRDDLGTTDDHPKANEDMPPKDDALDMVEKV